MRNSAGYTRKIVTKTSYKFKHKKHVTRWLRLRGATMLTDNTTEVLTADEVAKLLRLDRKTVYTAAAKGEIPCRRIGRKLLFNRSTLMAWLAQQGHVTPGE